MQPMRDRLILAALGLALAAPLAAQEAPAPAADAPAAPAPEAPAGQAPAAEAPAAPEAPAAQAPAAPGGEAPGNPAVGDPAKREVMEIVRDTFGAWEIRCAPDGKECFMYQLALDERKNPVAEVSLLKLPEAAEAVAGVTVVAPLGTLLTAGVVVQVDGGERRQYPFAWCSQVGCFARFGLTQPSVDGMKRGKGGTITLVSITAPQSPVTVDLSLTGFTAAYDSLEIPPAPPGMPAPAAAPRPAPPRDLGPAPLAPRN
jgi:invasion protein IalB